MSACLWRRAAVRPDPVSGDMEARLKSAIWIKALIRRCDLAAIPVAVLARGDDDAGAILLKFNARETGCMVLAQARGRDGELFWMKATGPAAVAEARRRCLHRAPTSARPRPLGGRNRERVCRSRHRHPDRVKMVKSLPVTAPPHPDVEIAHSQSISARHLRIDTIRFRHRLFSGEWSAERNYEVLRRGQAVAIVLYDPDHDRVVLIEQFRLPALLAGQLALAARNGRRADRYRRDTASGGRARDR